MFLLGIGGAEEESTLDTGLEAEFAVDDPFCGLERAVCCVEMALGAASRSSDVSR